MTEAPHGPAVSGPSIRALVTLAEMQEASALLRDVWGGDRDAMPAPLMRALAHSGNYVVGLFDGERMVGASVAFFEAPARRAMHSHITGVHPDVQGRGIGRALKQHQREWALARDVGHISWTFDPLVARNAHFNLRVLGARITEYLPDQYGPMDDGINSGDESDRVMVSWALAAPAAPTPAAGSVVQTVAVPPDVESLRRFAPADAAQWRVRVREAFLTHVSDGLVVGGFDDAHGYLFVRP
jgi:predicted GNAT superfamily acetyltransferase